MDASQILSLAASESQETESAMEREKGASKQLTPAEGMNLTTT